MNPPTWKRCATISIATRLRPEEAADIAFQGIINDQFYVFTTTAFDPRHSAAGGARSSHGNNPSFESIVEMSRKDSEGRAGNDRVTRFAGRSLVVTGAASGIGLRRLRRSLPEGGRVGWSTAIGARRRSRLRG